MTLRFSRPLSEMRPVLMDSNTTGPDPVYVVHQDLDNGWINKTELSAGLYGQEYPKTFGHIHADGKDEIYHIESGVGLLFLQNDKEVLLIKAVAGEEIKIPKEYSHAWINIGNTPLISFDDHKDPKDDYSIVASRHGLGYYIINDNGQPKAVPNPNYQNLPQPQWLTTNEFKNR